MSGYADPKHFAFEDYAGAWWQRATRPSTSGGVTDGWECKTCQVFVEYAHDISAELHFPKCPYFGVTKTAEEGKVKKGEVNEKPMTPPPPSVGEGGTSKQKDDCVPSSPAENEDVRQALLFAESLTPFEGFKHLEQVLLDGRKSGVLSDNDESLILDASDVLWAKMVKEERAKTDARYGWPTPEKICAAIDDLLNPLLNPFVKGLGVLDALRVIMDHIEKRRRECIQKWLQENEANK